MIILDIYKRTITKREQFTTTLNSELLERFKILAIHKKRTPNKLLEEAIQDLLKKYDKKTKKQYDHSLHEI